MEQILFDNIHLSAVQIHNDFDINILYLMHFWISYVTSRGLFFIFNDLRWEVIVCLVVMAECFTIAIYLTFLVIKFSNIYKSVFTLGIRKYT